MSVLAADRPMACDMQGLPVPQSLGAVSRERLAVMCLLLPRCMMEPYSRELALAVSTERSGSQCTCFRCTAERVQAVVAAPCRWHAWKRMPAWGTYVRSRLPWPGPCRQSQVQVNRAACPRTDTREHNDTLSILIRAAPGLAEMRCFMNRNAQRLNDDLTPRPSIHLDQHAVTRCGTTARDGCTWRLCWTKCMMPDKPHPQCQHPRLAGHQGMPLVAFSLAIGTQH
jgi:hypothetical protein